MTRREKRRRHRVSLGISADVHAGDVTFNAMVANLSLGGACLLTTRPLAIGTECRMTISLEGADDPARCMLDVVVVRVAPGELGVEFNAVVGLTSYEHLKNLLLYNSLEAELVRRELDLTIGLRPVREVPESIGEQPKTHMRALVIDDSRAIRSVLRRELASLGFDVFDAGDGVEALGRLPELWPIDVMLVDWNMPRMSGLDVIRAVRGTQAFHDVRILMVTSDTELAHVADALEAGANEYLMKPFDAEALREKLALTGLAVAG